MGETSSSFRGCMRCLVGVRGSSSSMSGCKCICGAKESINIRACKAAPDALDKEKSLMFSRKIGGHPFLELTLTPGTDGGWGDLKNKGSDFLRRQDLFIDSCGEKLNLIFQCTINKIHIMTFAKPKHTKNAAHALMQSHTQGDASHPNPSAFGLKASQ